MFIKSSVEGGTVGAPWKRCISARAKLASRVAAEPRLGVGGNRHLNFNTYCCMPTAKHSFLSWHAYWIKATNVASYNPTDCGTHQWRHLSWTSRWSPIQTAIKLSITSPFSGIGVSHGRAFYCFSARDGGDIKSSSQCLNVTTSNMRETYDGCRDGDVTARLVAVCIWP